MAKFICIITLIITTACSGMKYNHEPKISHLNLPLPNEVVYANVGDKMLLQGYFIETQQLVLNKDASGICYNIPLGSYLIAGDDDKKLYFQTHGKVENSVLCDLAKGLFVFRDRPSRLCVVAGMGGATCYEASYSIEGYETALPSKRNQSLLYSGYDGTKVFFTYIEEYKGAVYFTHDVQYDLAEVKSIAYRGAIIDIYDFNNGQISYKVVRHFENNDSVIPVASDPVPNSRNNTM